MNPEQAIANLGLHEASIADWGASAKHPDAPIVATRGFQRAATVCCFLWTEEGKDIKTTESIVDWHEPTVPVSYTTVTLHPSYKVEGKFVGIGIAIDCKPCLYY